MSPNKAKRRRTQVRLAQRAYRSRKEAELQALKTRAHELEMLIERMNEKFISFTDDLIKSGMLSKRPDVAWGLHQTIAQSLFLANQVVSVAADDADPLDVERNVPETRASGADIDATEGDIYNANDTYDYARIPLPDIQELTAQVRREDSSQDPFAVTQGYDPAVPEIPIQATRPCPTPLSLNSPLPNTHTLERASFARRLYRACVEQGHQCLTNPSHHFEELAYKFRLSMKLFPLQHIIAHFEEFLSGRHHEAIMELNVPFISIGGAGTHFQHQQRSYLADNTSFQPSVIQVAAEQVDPDMRGDWFDCYDVEGYLEECRIVPVRGLPLAKMKFPTFPGLERDRSHQQISGLNAPQHSGSQKIIDEITLIQRKSTWSSQLS
ncbi:hypothetical protein AnigIFM49718_008228 [Aspergillus niger]|nr:hypothetical protein AnigIFM49718_008228 [Aspergillus niger]